jgi:hypothetical protein
MSGANGKSDYERIMERLRGVVERKVQDRLKERHEEELAAGRAATVAMQTLPVLLQAVEVHSWSRRQDGSLLCETITLAAEDFRGC